MKEHVQQFFEEFKKLQEKYGVRVHADYEEEIDYNWEEEPYVSGVDSYLAIYNQDETKKLAIVNEQNELIEAEE